MGRPSTYTVAIADEICERLSDGEPLMQICRDDKLPKLRTVYDWRDADKEFAARFARAREEGYDVIAQDCLEISDETSRDTIRTERGEIPNSEWIARSRLRVETRLKLLAKWSPKKYGDKIDVEHSGNLDIVVTIGGKAEG